MKRILRIGMDVHSTNYTLCAIEPRFDGDDIIYANVKVTPDPDNIVQFIENIRKKVKEECDILCGYEAGCLGFSLYHELIKKGIRCVILAPTTMLTQQGKRIKTWESGESGQPNGHQSPEPGESSQSAGQQSQESGESGQPAGQQSQESGESGQTAGQQSRESGESGQTAGQQSQESGKPDQGSRESVQPSGAGDQTGQVDTMDSAKVIALTDAGLTEEEVTFTKEKLDWDDGVAVYDIDFYTADREYEYEINAATGVIMDRSVELFRHPGGAGTASLIGEEKAKETAAAHAGFSVDEVFFTKIKLEEEDGRLEYEIEFYKDRIEYEFTIDAAAGTVLEYESEYDD